MAILFDDADDYFTITDAASMTLQDGDWCIGIWTKEINSPAFFPWLLSSGLLLATPSIHFYHATSNNEWHAPFVDDDGTVVHPTTGAIAFGDGKWRLFVIQRRTADNEVQIWTCEFGQAAAKAGSVADTNFNAVDCGNWRIGLDSDEGYDAFGNIACEFFKGNFALTSEEITALGARMPGWALGHALDVYLPMTESIATLKDLVGSNNAARSSAPTTAEHVPILTLGGSIYVEYEVVGGQVYYRSIAGVFTPAGITTKKTKTPKTGAITMSGVVIGKAKKVLAGAFTSSGVLLGKAKKVLAGALTSSGVLAKKTSKTFAGTLTSAGALVRKASKVVSGAITFVGASLRTMKFARTVLAGTITFSGAVVKKAKRTLTGGFTSAGILVSKAKKLLAGSLTPSGITTKKTAKSFAGALTYVGALTFTKVFHRVLAGAITFTGALTRKTGKVLTGAVTLAGAISRLTRKILSGALTFIGRVTGLAPVVAVPLTLNARSTDLTLRARSADLTLEPRSTDLTLPSR